MMSIFGGGSNLPPGCSVSDIPGNSPEDGKWEAMIENFFDRKRMKSRKFGIRISSKEYRAMSAIYRAKKYRKIQEAVDTYIIAAIEYGIEIGSTETRENILCDQAMYKDYINNKRQPKLIAYFKHLRQTRKEMYEALKIAQDWFVEMKNYIPLHKVTLSTINNALADSKPTPITYDTW